MVYSSGWKLWFPVHKISRQYTRNALMGSKNVLHMSKLLEKELAKSKGHQNYFQRFLPVIPEGSNIMA